MAERAEIEELLPHRGALRWLDAVEREPAGSLRCRARVREDNPFLVEGRLPALCLCELLAQAGAALAGLEARVRGQAAGPGYLIAIRELDLRGAHGVGVGAELEARVQVLASRPSELGEYCELEGEIALGRLPIARGSLGLLRLPGRPPAPRLASSESSAPGEGPLPGLVLDELRSDAELLRARLTVSSSCPLFADHFPGHPVLPAAAELLAVAWVARGAGWLGADEPERIGRSKFRRPILPGSVLELTLRRDGDTLRWSLGDDAAVGSGELRGARGRSAPGGGG